EFLPYFHQTIVLCARRHPHSLFFARTKRAEISIFDRNDDKPTEPVRGCGFETQCCRPCPFPAPTALSVRTLQDTAQLHGTARPAYNRRPVTPLRAPASSPASILHCKQVEFLRNFPPYLAV
ncbi:unnamed protein product, partial [Ectocarpus sp. 12 AP-2014]